jgi:hypothetical protein
MSTSFLDLPREIRDIIYEHVLISSTGYVAPILDKSSRSLRFSLHTANGDEPSRNETTDRNKIILSNNDVLSLSLPRTCRQIWQETDGIFWSNNAFLFEDPTAMTRTLKSMGQVPSRRIETISFRLNNRHWRVLPKAFALLASRARHGSFQKLHLDLPRKEFAVLTYWKHFGDASHTGRYDEVLEVLRDASEECNFRRSIRIYGGDYEMAAKESDTIRDLHLAFGGCMIYDGKLQWNNYKPVGTYIGAS